MSDDVYDLLDRAYESDDVDEIAALTERALELDPDNPEALLMKADLIEDDDEGRLLILERALAEARRYFEEQGLVGDAILNDDSAFVYFAILQRAAYVRFIIEDDDGAMELLEELLPFDADDQMLSKTLYYRILLERGEWAAVLEDTMKQTARSLGWAYSKIIATYMLSAQGKGGKMSDIAQINKMLWDAIEMSPDVPFYMLGYFPDPVDDTEEEETAFDFGLLFEGIWTVSRDMLNWFSKSVILFGLLTGRFADEQDDMMEILDALGGAEDYKELSGALGHADDDKAVLRAISSGRYPKAR
ncbi:hypothetical protein FACS1894204_07850 [Synergistales bacterium]|nr:hypothetical protein FACS1894204_07850 [Synergistales bacterium]